MIRFALAAPGALFSFAFRKTTLALWRTLAKRAKVPPAREWQPFSDAFLDARPDHFVSSMIMGPRWNTHALVALAGPLDVDGPLEVEVSRCRASARAWTLVANRFPGLGTAASLDSLDPAAREGDWAELRLPPGRYGLALRYYHWDERPELPALRCAGAELVPSKPVSPGVVSVWANLRKRRRRVYLWMNAYVFFLLRFASSFSKRRIEDELLPVGNPRTRFVYGHAHAGERLAVHVPERLLARHAVYLTFYSRDSFPLHSVEVCAAFHETPPCEEDGYYVVRVHAERPSAGPDEEQEDRTAQVRVERVTRSLVRA